MKELADHLEFFAQQGVTHLRIAAAPAEAKDAESSSAKSRSEGGPPASAEGPNQVSSRRSGHAEAGERRAGSQQPPAPWEEKAAHPAFRQAAVPEEEGQSDLFASRGAVGPASQAGRDESGTSQSSAHESEETVSDTPINTSAPELPQEPIEMEEIRHILGDCTRCPLSETRTQLVFGVGNPSADLLFVGEAPGADEDELGLPFVGAAGKLLSRIIRAIDLYRDQVYVANILKCRPPNNRDPLPEEVEQCGPFLYKQIQAVEPLVIVALGRYAAQTLLQTETPISSLRGRFHDFHGIPLMPTFHPSYLLRNASGKRPVWEDMQAVRDKLKEQGSLYYAERD